MMLPLKCSDIKKVKSLKDLIIIDWVLGGKPTKKYINSNFVFINGGMEGLFH